MKQFNKSYFWGQLVVLLLVLSGPIFSKPSVEIGGHFFGAMNGFYQSNSSGSEGKRQQFDYAANVDVLYRLSDKIFGIIQFQGSPGAGSLGFPGEELIVTDLYLTYITDQNTEFTFGSFDAPFGLQTESLSNNADTFRNPFILNSLLYSSFVSAPIGTLNTVGLKIERQYDFGTVVSSVTNGTSESAINTDGNFGTIQRLSTDKVLEGHHFAVSYMRSNEFQSNPAPNSGFNADFEGIILDWHYSGMDTVMLKIYSAWLEYGDRNPATEDKVVSWMMEASKEFDGWSLAARLSSWMPKDDDGNGAGISSVMPAAGLATSVNGNSPALDQDVIRAQLAVTYPLEDNLLVKTEVFLDNYKKEVAGSQTDVPGFLISLNMQF